MDRDAEIEGLRSPPATIAVRKAGSHPGQNVVVRSDRLPDDQRLRLFESLPDALAAGHFAHPRVTRAVRQDHDISGKERAVRAAEVQKHAVAAGDRNDPHAGNGGGRGILL